MGRSRRGSRGAGGSRGDAGSGVPGAGGLDEYERKRDFARTPEPPAKGDRTARKAASKGRRSKPRRSSAGRTSPRATLEFVVQKHAASHLHFDFRLELDGVMKSWAVPKGPSPDPAVRRLAMETEDHPLEYNGFEGVIPEGEYGGGTVMIWDRGRYYADEAEPGDDARVLRREYRAGKLSVTLEGERLRGSYALVRTRGAGRKPSWLLLKHRDRHAREGGDLVAEHVTSVVSGRTMEEIATGRSKVWRSNRSQATARGASPARSGGRNATRSGGRKAAGSGRGGGSAAGESGAAGFAGAGIPPMVAAAAKRVPEGGAWRFEPSPGGTRVMAYVTPDAVRLLTTRGDDRVAHHPSIGRELARLAARKERSVVLDGELVAPRGGEPVLYVFDLLYADGDVLLGEPYDERRARLDALYRRRRQQHVQVVPAYDDAEDAAAAAAVPGWTGIVAKRADAPYRPGSRGRSWLRLSLPR